MFNRLFLSIITATALTTVANVAPIHAQTVFGQINGSHTGTFPGGTNGQSSASGGSIGTVSASSQSGSMSNSTATTGMAAARQDNMAGPVGGTAQSTFGNITVGANVGNSLFSAGSSAGGGTAALAGSNSNNTSSATPTTGNAFGNFFANFGASK
jgi:hypothetical protein